MGREHSARPYPYIGEFTAANSNGSQLPAGSSVFTGDEGSATLVVDKGINRAIGTASSIPNGFYSENLSLVNTYDTDTTTTTTTYASTANGTCVTGQGAAMNYAALYNSQQLCASQALVIWITSDLTVMNNIYATSLQDTIYAESQGSGSNGYVPSREYWFRGKVTGDVDFIFGDAAAVFDSTSIYTAWHGSTATGTETIHAQRKYVQTGSANDYLSGYVMNNNVFTSQSPGMTSLYFGRPYQTYSTWVMLNSYVDQVNPLGYTTGLGPSLSTTTFLEYNTLPYTDPATGAADLNGIPYLGSGGNTGVGVTGPRETSSMNPGTPEANNVPPTSLTPAQAQAFYPNNFLGQTVPQLDLFDAELDSHYRACDGGQCFRSIRHNGYGERRGKHHNPDAAADSGAGRDHEWNVHHSNGYVHAEGRYDHAGVRHAECFRRSVLHDQLAGGGQPQHYMDVWRRLQFRWLDDRNAADADVAGGPFTHHNCPGGE